MNVNWFRTNMIMIMIASITFTFLFWGGVAYVTYLAFNKYTASPQEILDNRQLNQTK